MSPDDASQQQQQQQEDETSTQHAARQHNEEESGKRRIRTYYVGDATNYALVEGCIASTAVVGGFLWAEPRYAWARRMPFGYKAALGLGTGIATYLGFMSRSMPTVHAQGRADPHPTAVAATAADNTFVLTHRGQFPRWAGEHPTLAACAALAPCTAYAAYASYKYPGLPFAQRAARGGGFAKSPALMAVGTTMLGVVGIIAVWSAPKHQKPGKAIN
ncbi:hypothetical protein JKP88DRAFT_283379 [Tribonema minus]|uniref:Uncharacterized protein n=1 Tax=Tribonema minus TaxID=303371 RepID=A0A835YKY5_9STRA|nr:hypothetical protein JKP88DRAFT_283379 [Tribonema minus]